MEKDRLTLLEGKVKELKVQLDSIESNVKINYCCISEMETDQEDADDKIEKLKDRVTQLERDLDIFKKTGHLEESVEVLKVQNTELRDHLNLVINMVNNITSVLNNNNNEQIAEGVDEVDSTQSNDEPIQLTVQQVYDMYQSQPPDEEGWQEMTNAIKAAEEYEAGLQKQEFSTRVNGLTQDEWNDLLRI